MEKNVTSHDSIESNVIIDDKIAKTLDDYSNELNISMQAPLVEPDSFYTDILQPVDYYHLDSLVNAVRRRLCK